MISDASKGLAGHDRSTMMTTIYHVTRSWDGNNLRSLAKQIDDGDRGLDEAIQEVADKWFGGDLRQAEEYAGDDGREVHCHATTAEAIEYRDEWCDGGEILAIEYDDECEELRVYDGREYKHPVVWEMIPAEMIKVLTEV
jgi:hypothetical protein